jgi:hypothetical protein
MKEAELGRVRDLIQQDVNRRGLRTDPDRNLINACPDDFRLACASLAVHPRPTLAVVTGFFIPTGQPPCGETDGPLGAVFLARALRPLGIRIVIGTDDFCAQAVQAGLNFCGLRKDVPLVVLPAADRAGIMTMGEYQRYFLDRTGPITHLLAIERVGPSHTLDSLQKTGAAEATVRAFLETVPPEDQDRCHTMRGRDITSTMSPAHRLFESAADDPAVTTIGIGDGGNEIGMGKIPWDVIRANVSGGGLVACRVPTRHLIVCGISNWGGYGLAAGVRLLRAAPPDADLWKPEYEFQILERMVEAGPLVDGVTGLATPTVDGLTFEKYAEVMDQLRSLEALK